MARTSLPELSVILMTIVLRGPQHCLKQKLESSWQKEGIRAKDLSRDGLAGKSTFFGIIDLLEGWVQDVVLVLGGNSSEN